MMFMPPSMPNLHIQAFECILPNIAVSSSYETGFLSK